MRIRTFIAACALVLAGCSDEDVRVGGHGVDGAMTFSGQEAVLAKGAWAVSRASSLEGKHTQFSVWVKKSMEGETEVQTVMDGYEVEYVSAKPSSGGATWGNVEGKSFWSYDHITGQTLKYWDLAAKEYVFAAVAPKATTATKAGTETTVAVDDAGKITLSLADLNTDWMLARTVRTMATPADRDDIDSDFQLPTPGSKDGKVPLNFHRILAKVVFKAYADDELEIDPLEVGFKNIDGTPAGYNSADGWTSKTSTEYQKVYDNGGEKTVITADNNSPETALGLTELYVIPQTLTDTDDSPLVNIIVKQENDDTQTATLNIPGQWEPNKIYTYYLKFDTFNPTDVMLFYVVVDDWEHGYEDEKEDEEHNW